MRNAILLFAGLVAASWLFVLYDWLTRRPDRKSQHGRA
jgi:uncharacterized metal-binding protein